MLEYKTRILLVEDEEDAREILSFYLENVFDEVFVASNGKEGLELYKKNSLNDKYIDLVITDIKMPNMDGFELIENVTKINPEQKFIIVSAYKDEEYLFKSINLNVMSYFVKPLELKNMMELLKKIKTKVIEDKNELKNDSKLIYINKTYKFDLQSNLLYKDLKSVNLTKKETLLLKVLIEEKNKVVTTEDLKYKIWDDITISDATVRTVLKRLKDKIIDDDFIISKKGIGYIIEIL